MINLEKDQIYCLLLTEEESAAFCLPMYKRDALKLLLNELMYKKTDDLFLNPVCFQEIITEYAQTLMHIDELLHTCLSNDFAQDDIIMLTQSRAYDINVTPFEQVLTITKIL